MKSMDSHATLRPRNSHLNGRKILPSGVKTADHKTNKGAKMVINSLTIIIVAGICFALYAAFRLGQEVGYDSGYIAGRKAIRAYYESLDK